MAPDKYVGRVMVDFDSTIADFDGHLINTLNEKFGSEYVLGDMKTWDFLQEMDPDHVKYTWGDGVYHSREWTLSIPPLAGAVEGMHQLVDAGWYPRIVTARVKNHYPWLREWLDTRGLQKIPLTCNKDKHIWVDRYGYSVAIEDAPHHVLDLAARNVMVFMIDKPYNDYVQERWNIMRVPSLRAAANHIVGGEEVVERSDVGEIESIIRPVAYQGGRIISAPAYTFAE